MHVSTVSDDAEQGEDAPVHAAGQRRIGFAVARGAGEQRRRRERGQRRAAANTVFKVYGMIS